MNNILVCNKKILKLLGEKVRDYLEGKNDFEVLDKFILEIELQGAFEDKLTRQIAHALYHYDQDIFTHKNNLIYLSGMKNLMSKISDMMTQCNRDGISVLLDKFYNLPIDK